MTLRLTNIFKMDKVESYRINDVWGNKLIRKGLTEGHRPISKSYWNESVCIPGPLKKRKFKALLSFTFQTQKLHLPFKLSIVPTGKYPHVDQNKSTI